MFAASLGRRDCWLTDAVSNPGTGFRHGLCGGVGDGPCLLGCWTGRGWPRNHCVLRAGMSANTCSGVISLSELTLQGPSTSRITVRFFMVPLSSLGSGPGSQARGSTWCLVIHLGSLSQNAKFA